MKTLFCALILATFSAAAASADIVITFDDPDQTAAPGDTLQFFGAITNTSVSDTVFLNSDDLSLLGLSFTINDLFFTNVPLTLDPGGSSGDIELFDVTVSKPLLDAAGKYLGSYILLGGLDGDAQDNLATASFSVTTTPEPSAIYLLLGASVALALISRKARTRAPNRTA